MSRLRRSGLLRAAHTSPRRGVPSPRLSAFAVSHDPDGLIPPGLCGVFRPLTSMGFGVPAPLMTPWISPRCPLTGDGSPGPKLPGCRLAVTAHDVSRRSAETVHLLTPRVAPPWPPPLQLPEGFWSGSGPLIIPSHYVRVRPTEVVLRVSASPVRVDPKASSWWLASRASSPDPLRSVLSRVAPGPRVPTAHTRVTASGVPVPPGSGPPSPHPKMEPRRARCAPGRAASRRLDRSRLLASSAHCPDQPHHTLTEVFVRLVRSGC